MGAFLDYIFDCFREIGQIEPKTGKKKSQRFLM